MANSILQSMQYDSNKYTSISLFESGIIYAIKRKAIDKSYEKSCLVVEDYNNVKKMAF